MCDGRQDKEHDILMGKANAVMQGLQYLVVVKRDVEKSKALSFQTISFLWS